MESKQMPIYNGVELIECTTSQIFDPPRMMLVWDSDSYGDRNATPTQREVYAIINKNGKHGVLAMDKFSKFSLWDHCAKIPEPPKPRRATERELAQWCAQGHGEWSNTIICGDRIIKCTFAFRDTNQPCEVEAGIVIRKWEDTEWHDPTVDYMGIDP